MTAVNNWGCRQGFRGICRPSCVTDVWLKPMIATWHRSAMCRRPGLRSAHTLHRTSHKVTWQHNVVLTRMVGRLRSAPAPHVGLRDLGMEVSVYRQASRDRPCYIRRMHTTEPPTFFNWGPLWRVISLSFPSLFRISYTL